VSHGQKPAAAQASLTSSWQRQRIAMVSTYSGSQKCTSHTKAGAFFYEEETERKP
jgi:hypothetical protein